MPLSFPVEHANQILVIVSGATELQEMMDFIAQSRRGEKRDHAFLFDVSAASINITGDEMRGLAAFAAAEARTGPLGPVAFISTNPSAFGMSRMFQSYSTAEGRNNVGVFRSLADAQAWLKTLKREG